MTKVTESKFEIKGKSGKTYEFDIFKLDTSFNPIGGIYIFTRRYKRLDSKYYHELIYCGKTNDLSTRFDNHHKKDCIEKNKANCVCVKSVSSEQERTNIEQDILLGNNFKCNEILN
jgi:hypothetical protein